MNPDVTFTFNPASFITGIDAMSKALSVFEKKGNETEKTTQKKVNTLGMWAVAKGQLISQAISKGLSTLGSYLPEIGQTMSIAGDIFLKNLLWPLRKELVPALQSILNWVRDNRAMFVRWGQVLANVFRAIRTIFSGVIDMFKKAFQRLSDGLDKIFGKSRMSIEQGMNMLVFKITAIAMFIQTLLGPVFDFIVDSVLKMISFVKSFGEGFLETAGDIMGPLADIGSSFGRLLDLLGLTNDQTTALGGAFKILGNILGMTIQPILATIGQVLDAVATAIENVVRGVKIARAWLNDDSKTVEKLLREQETAGKEFQNRASARWSKVADNFVEGAKTIEKNYMMSAGVKPEAIQRSTTSNVSTKTSAVNNINMNFTQAMDPKQVGAAVTDAIKSTQRTRGQ